jgi:hypothetical protein
MNNACIQLIFRMIFSILFIVLLVSCKTVKPENDNLKADVIFIDSLSAAKAIIEDDIDGFFDQISIVDMAIQMKVSKDEPDRQTMVKKYNAFLRQSVSDWSSVEKKNMAEIFKQAEIMCNKISPQIWPKDIRLIKIKANHYGRDVYYTRGHNILIPENVFERSNLDDQLPIMLHEIFHLISRYNQVIKNDTYRLIGFEKSEKPVVVDPKLAKILLTNPDGVSNNYYLTLRNGEKSTKIIPMITSKAKSFKQASPAFFDYLSFDLYPVKSVGDQYVTVSDEQGKTTLDVGETPSFFQQIKDNTQYIIHPDEIIADNFMLAIQAYDKNEYKNFSPEGRQLIEDILFILKKM